MATTTAEPTQTTEVKEAVSPLSRDLFRTMESVSASYLSLARQKYGDTIGDARWAQETIKPLRGLGESESGHKGIGVWTITTGKEERKQLLVAMSGTVEGKPTSFLVSSSGDVFPYSETRSGEQGLLVDGSIPNASLRDVNGNSTVLIEGGPNIIPITNHSEELKAKNIWGLGASVEAPGSTTKMEFDFAPDYNARLVGRLTGELVDQVEAS